MGSNASLSSGSSRHPLDSPDTPRTHRYSSSDRLRGSVTFKSLEDTREEYIEKLKQRIRQLEKSPATSSRYDLDSAPPSPAPAVKSGKSAGARPPLPAKAIPGQKTSPPKSPPISARGSYDLSSLEQLDESAKPASGKPPRSPPIRARGSYDLSSFSKLGPIAKSKPSISSSSDSIPEKDPTMRLTKCSQCGRSFRLERIDKHTEVCGKSSRRRVVFDEKKMRVKGTDLENFKKPRSPDAGPPKKCKPAGTDLSNPGQKDTSQAGRGVCPSHR
ncbi:Zinc finger C2HC domain-containing protein 1C [Kappamyces sp. JEL0680]|nr:Zinc finger C2HC domain-containing protein 1C [Kappamyces sp. JEL0680]